ncbi:hypothetical protein R6Q59_021821 [Mikania micrantha]
MAMKYISLIIVLVVVLVTPQAEAQQLVSPSGLTTMLHVSGDVGCSLDGSINPAPPFPNALVNLVCGGSVIASNTTNQSGAFTILLTVLQTTITDLSSGACKIVVDTPLATCNASLPSTGTLEAPLQIVENIVNGLFNTLCVIKVYSKSKKMWSPRGHAKVWLKREVLKNRTGRRIGLLTGQMSDRSNRIQETG